MGWASGLMRLRHEILKTADNGFLKETHGPRDAGKQITGLFGNLGSGDFTKIQRHQDVILFCGEGWGSHVHEILTTKVQIKMTNTHIN